MKKVASLLQILIFVIFIGVFFVLHLALPDRSLIGRESLQSAPKLNFQNLVSGKFSTAAERYVNDQFPFREDWVSLKARCELLSGKDENNGVYLCEKETLLECFTAPEDSVLIGQMDHVNALAATAGVPVSFALIPTASEIWDSLLPVGAPNDSQARVIQAAHALADCPTVDLGSALAAHREEPVFYRTDHHWTTLGAYYAYESLGEVLGYEALPLDAYAPTTVSESFYGTAWSNSGFSWVRPDSIVTYVPQGAEQVRSRVGDKESEGSLYHPEKLEGIDQYAYFYGGNTPLFTVRTGNEGPKLLILRDSFMDSLSPFLFPHFSELHILDLRYYKNSLHDYISERGIDQVLICYSVENFAEDANLFLMER